MYDREVASLDWEQLWKKRLAKAERVKKQAVDWDGWAEDFEKQFARSDYRDRLIEKMEIRPGDSILDVGCGPATLAIPLASRADRITALDISAGMLRVGAERAKEKNIDNITFRQMDWEEVATGREIAPHDIVVCSRAFPGKKPKESLRKLNEAAKRRVYLTLRTDHDGAHDFYSMIYRQIGKEYIPAPDYIYCYNMLYQSGITANVDFIDYTDSFRYEKSDEAFRIINTHVQTENDEQAQILMGFIRRNISENGGFELDIKSRWALLRWDKQPVG